jgi:hypothetical protein
MKDRRCWGRPDRARTRSEDFVAQNDTGLSDNGSASALSDPFRFRTTSSADPLVMGFTSNHGWKRDRRALAGELLGSDRVKSNNDAVPLGGTLDFDKATNSVATQGKDEVGVLGSNSSTEENNNNKRANLARKKRSNTTSTMFVGSTMGAPDEEAQMWCVSAVVHAHMMRHVLEVKSSASTVTPRESIRYAVFNDGGIVHIASATNDAETDDEENSSEEDGKFVIMGVCLSIYVFVMLVRFVHSMLASKCVRRCLLPIKAYQ